MITGWKAALWQDDRSPWLSSRPRVKTGKPESPVVLVVDENIASLITLVYLLNNHGQPACGAGSVREALHTLRAGGNSIRSLVVSASVVRLDDGELVCACRSEFPHLRLIAVAEAPAIEFAHKADCFAYLERPFRVEQLLDLIRKAVRRTTAERSIA